MRIQTRGYSNNVWLSNDAGVIEGTLIMSAPTLEKILQAVNEKYGTSFEGWSQLPTVYEVGDTVPNWSAYEKIEIPSRMIALNISQDAPMFIFGGIKNDIYILSVDEGESSWLADEEGNILYDRGPSLDDKEFIIGLFSEQGISITDIVTSVKQYEAGQIVPNWSNYEKIPI